jgi:hypothetical protein
MKTLAYQAFRAAWRSIVPLCCGIKRASAISCAYHLRYCRDYADPPSAPEN